MYFVFVVSSMSQALYCEQIEWPIVSFFSSCFFSVFACLRLTMAETRLFSRWVSSVRYSGLAKQCASLRLGMVRP